MDHIGAIVLAAGKGTRMQSTDKNKVVLELENKPMVTYAVENLKKAGVGSVVVVVGFARKSVEKALGDGVIYAQQGERLGTGHAVKVGLPSVPKDIEHIVSVYGDDSAFFPPELISNLVQKHQNSESAVTLLTIKKEDPTGLGRIIRNENGNIIAIVEEKVATDEQRKVEEINTGLYCFNRKFLDENIEKINKNDISGEYYLTDIVEIAVSQNLPVKALFWEDSSVWHGVNNLDELKSAKKLMQQKS